MFLLIRRYHSKFRYIIAVRINIMYSFFQRTFGDVQLWTYVWCVKSGCLDASSNNIITSGLILGLRPTNGRRHYLVTTSLIGLAQPRISPVISYNSGWKKNPNNNYAIVATMDFILQLGRITLYHSLLHMEYLDCVHVQCIQWKHCLTQSAICVSCL